MNIRKIEAITKEAFYKNAKEEKKRNKKAVKKAIKKAAENGKSFCQVPYIDDELKEDLLKDGFIIKETVKPSFPEYNYSIHWCSETRNFDERI